MITTRQIEAWAPFGIATAIAITWWSKDATIPEIYSKELLSAMLSVAAICAGFLTTALSILLPIGSTETGKKMHSNGLLEPVQVYLRAAVFSCFLWAGVCLISFFLLPPDKPIIGTAISTALVWSTSYAATAMVRIAEVLLNIFHRLSVPSDDS